MVTGILAEVQDRGVYAWSAHGQAVSRSNGPYNGQYYRRNSFKLVLTHGTCRTVRRNSV